MELGLPENSVNNLVSIATMRRIDPDTFHRYAQMAKERFKPNRGKPDCGGLLWTYLKNHKQEQVEEPQEPQQQQRPALRAMGAGPMPIPTTYNGVTFKSRLEARWAVFFEQQHIAYLYEYEGYDLGDAGMYLPDFWLPDDGYYVEIKPSGLPEEYMEQCRNKCGALAKSTGRVVMMLFDCAAPGRGEAFKPDGSRKEIAWGTKPKVSAAFEAAQKASFYSPE